MKKFSVIKGKHERGFVLAVSMIFLVIMTGLAVTAIRRSTLDEKSAGNLRAQNLAFQAAERALRFCEGALDLTAGSAGICEGKPGLAGILASVNILGRVGDMSHPAREADPYNPQANFPEQWKTQENWTGNNPIATRIANVASDPDFVANVAQQPQCMIEAWSFAARPGLGESPKSAYVITARGVGSTASAVVWLQETVRCGT